MYRLVTEVIGQAHRIVFPLNPIRCQQTAHLTRKHHHVVGVGEIQRLNAHAVAGQRQFSARLVPIRKRKHPVEFGERRTAPNLHGSENDLGIAIGLKRVIATKLGS